MAVTARIPIWTTSGGNLQPVTTGSYDIRVSPFSSAGIAGAHIGNGIWMFESVVDSAEYKVYNTTAGTEMTSITGGGAHTLAFYDTDLSAYLAKTGGTMSGAIAMGSNKITGLAAGTANGDAVRFEQAILTTGTQTKAGQLLFDSTGSIVPAVLQPRTTGYPGNEGHLTSKYYVDTLFASAIGVVQAPYLIKLLPSRTTEDIYSRPTVEKCNTYLSGLTSISTFRGTMLIEALGQASNAINLDDGTSQWISAGVDIVGLNRPTLTRRGYNSSLTVACSLRGVKIVDDTVVSARSYTNFTFNDCWFYVNATEMAFTTCKFYNCVFQFAGGEAVTFSNCTGSNVIYNDDADVTFSGTQPASIISTASTNIGF